MTNITQNFQPRFFARFSTLGQSPTANVLYIKEDKTDGFSLTMKFLDNRLWEWEDPRPEVPFTLKDYNKLVEAILGYGYVEVPEAVADILEANDYWSSFSKYEQYITSPEFTKAVKNYAGYDGIPHLS